MKKPPVKRTEYLAFRLADPHRARFARVLSVSKRSKTSLLTECVERALPAMERQYKQDLAKVA